MKRYLPLLLVVLLVLLSGCGELGSVFGLSRGGDVDNAGRTIQSCGTYTERDIAAAMDAVTRYFANGFESCTLLDLRYDGDSSADAEREWAAQYNAPRAMVLKSDFRTGSGNPTLNPYSTYRNWNWVLVWERGWTVKTCGYG